MSGIKQVVKKIESILNLTLEKEFKPGNNSYKAVGQKSYTLTELSEMSNELIHFGFVPQLANLIYNEILYLEYEGILVSIYTDAEIILRESDSVFEI